MPSQLPLPLQTPAAMSREDFIVAPGNAQAIGFIDRWPDWPVPVAAIYGPSGSGKTHLVEVWKAASGAVSVHASELQHATPHIDRAIPLAIEDVDLVPASSVRDGALFSLMEKPGAAVLLTGREPPASWPAVLPDLASRFRALLAFPLWLPDEALLKSLAGKLFSDRQLQVPQTVIERIVHSLERSPGAVRAFVAEADARALAEGRSVNLSLVRQMLGEREPGPPLS